MQTSSHTRDSYWDVVKGSLIFLVVLGHFFQLYLGKVGGGVPVLEALLCLIYFFHMPLFVFVSGMFSRNVTKRRDQAFADLIIPFLVAQVLWLTIRAVWNGPHYALSVAFVPQFGLWYLVALFIWRLILPDLARVRFILPISVALFFFGQFYSGIDNMFALQRTLGFLCFFLFGWRFGSVRALKAVEKIPLFAAFVFIAFFVGGLYAAFASERISYTTVFYVLTHGTHINSSSGYVLGTVAYAVAFIGAIALSVAFLRLVLLFKSSSFLARVGARTMPIYLTHGYIVYALIFLLVRLVTLSEPLALLVFLGLTVVIVTLFSTDAFCRAYDRAIDLVGRLVLRGRTDGQTECRAEGQKEG